MLFSVVLPDVLVSHVGEVETGFEPAWTALQAAASPLGHSTVVVLHL
jgi:hypothetical protein